MKLFQTKSSSLSGSSYSEIITQARVILRYYEKRTKRQAYIRAIYFNKEKIFFTYFMEHMINKRPADRVRRLKLLPCAIELLQSNNLDPESQKHYQSYTLHRFAGISKDKVFFAVQVKHDLRTNRKYFMSVFPIENK